MNNEINTKKDFYPDPYNSNASFSHQYGIHFKFIT